MDLTNNDSNNNNNNSHRNSIGTNSNNKYENYRGTPNRVNNSIDKKGLIKRNGPLTYSNRT